MSCTVRPRWREGWCDFKHCSLKGWNYSRTQTIQHLKLIFLTHSQALMTASLIECSHRGAKIMFFLMTCQMMDFSGYFPDSENFQREGREGRTSSRSYMTTGPDEEASCGLRKRWRAWQRREATWCPCWEPGSSQYCWDQPHKYHRKLIRDASSATPTPSSTKGGSDFWEALTGNTKLTVDGNRK